MFTLGNDNLAYYLQVIIIITLIIIIIKNCYIILK